MQILLRGKEVLRPIALVHFLFRNKGPEFDSPHPHIENWLIKLLIRQGNS